MSIWKDLQVIVKEKAFSRYGQLGHSNEVVDAVARNIQDEITQYMNGDLDWAKMTADAQQSVLDWEMYENEVGNVTTSII